MATITRPAVRAKPGPAKPGPAKNAASNGTGKVTLTLEWVDAQTAAQWLELNVSNRAIRQRKVVEYRRDMLAGEWRSVGETIKFDTAGKLCDGQHRLLALVAAASGRPGFKLELSVARGIRPEDRVVIDTGSKRTAGDQLKMSGYRNSALLAAAAKWCLMVDRKTMYADGALKSLTHPEILAYIEENPELVRICEVVANRLRSHIDIPPGYVAATYFLCSRLDPDEAEEFFDRLADGVNMELHDPIMALRRRLQRLTKAKAHLTSEAWLSLLFRTWNARRTGRSLQSIPVDKDGVTVRTPDLK